MRNPARRPGAVTTALVQEDDPVFVRIKVTPVICITARTRPAMQKNDRQAGCIPGLFKIDAMPVAFQLIYGAGLDFRIELRQGGAALG